MASKTRIRRATLLAAATSVILALGAACSSVQPGGAPAPTAPGVASQDVAGTVTGGVSTGASSLTCDGSTSVSVSLDAQAGIAGHAKKILLLVDVSGSMQVVLPQVKAAAKGFVDLLDTNTDGISDGQITNGTTVGLIAISDDATLVQAPTSSAADLDTAIDGLTAGGATNIAAAFNLAAESSPDVVVLLTDGRPTVPDSPQYATAQADQAAVNLKAVPTEIFTIGFEHPDIANLERWATDPSHVYLLGYGQTLAELFNAVGVAIIQPAATNVTVVDTVSPAFTVSGASVDKGTLSVSGNTLTWTVDQLLTETASLSYTITHDIGAAGGTLPVSSSIAYSDAAGAAVSFPDATVDVHGCASALALTPAASTAPVGSTASLTATVTDDFGDAVPGIALDFTVAPGTSVITGDPGAPSPASGSGTTDAAGQATFDFADAVAATDAVTATAAPQPRVASTLSDTASVTWVPIPAELILPGSHGANSHGVIPVTVLGSADLDVSAIDPSTVVFGRCTTPPPDAHIAHGSGHPANVNNDAYGDVVYHFWFQQTGLTGADTQACIYGKTTAGLAFMGQGSLRIVP